MEKLFNNLVIIFSTFCCCFAQSIDSSMAVSASPDGVESKVVIITAEVNPVNFKPTAYRFSLFPRHRPSEVYISRMFFPGDSLQVVLPENILEADTLANIASLEPVGGSFEKSYRLFTKRSESIDLGTFIIKEKSDIVKLSVIDGQKDIVVSRPKVKIFQSGKIIFNTTLDSSGYGRLRIPITRNKEIPLNMLIDTDGEYPIWRGLLEVSEGVSRKTIALSSMDLMQGESLFRVLRDLTPFRKGPENGAEILFLLNEDDHVVISRSAGDRLYGRVRLDLHNKQSSNYFNGWILSNDVQYLETLASEVKNEK